MSGFRTVGQYVAAHDNGQKWFTQFRKLVASAATVQNAWIDYTYSGGSPSANFYASAPLEAAHVETARGLYVPTVAPAKQFLKNLMVMTLSPVSTSGPNGRQMLILADYLLYYPFIDTDAVGEQQDLENSTATIPRYSAGRVVAVGQSASSAIGTFTFTYTNQDGVPGRASPANSTFIIGGGGHVVGASDVGASYTPFLGLQAGDSGVQSIQSVTMSVAGGGLMCLVIVQPLLTATVTQECRRDGTALVSYGAADEFSSLIHHQPPEIIDGAVLGILAAGFAGSLASSTLVGNIETIWN